MNLTVGPLPPAVYWRRRAIVLGGLLLVVLLIAYACSGSNTSNASGPQNSPSTNPIVTLPTSTPGLPSEFPSQFPSGLSSQSTGALPPSTPSSDGPLPSANPSPSVVSGPIPLCTDDQIKVTPVISSTSPTTSSLIHGGTFDLKLKIRNVSTVTCRRDVGSAPEELSIASADGTIHWSSDDCAPASSKQQDIRTFAPDIEIYADVKWSSYSTNGCTKTATPAPVGTYTLTGRLGTKTASVPFKIVN